MRRRSTPALPRALFARFRVGVLGGAGEAAPAGGRGESEATTRLGGGGTPTISSAERSVGETVQRGRGARGPGEGDGGKTPRPRGQPPNSQKQPAKARRKRAANQATLKSAACSFVYWGFHCFCLEIPQRYYRTAFFHLERTINGRGRVIKSVIDVLANSFHIFVELLARHNGMFKNEFQIFANVGQTHSVLGKP